MPFPRSALPLLAILVLCSLPSGANAAARREKPVSPVDAAAAVGAQFWGSAPCGGHIVFLTRRTLPAGLAVESDAWVTFSSPLGANNLAAPASSYTACTISFGRSRWPTTASLRQDWDMFCMTMVHELGHLLGHTHDLTPGSVMAPIFTSYSSEPATCRVDRPRRA